MDGVISGLLTNAIWEPLKQLFGLSKGETAEDDQAVTDQMEKVIDKLPDNLETSDDLEECLDLLDGFSIEREDSTLPYNRQTEKQFKRER